MNPTTTHINEIPYSSNKVKGEITLISKKNSSFSHHLILMVKKLAVPVVCGD